MDGRLRGLAQLTINIGHGIQKNTTVLNETLGHISLRMSLFVSKFFKAGNKQRKHCCKGKASKQRSRIRLRNSLPVYFL